MKRAIICKGDPTSHGGKVIEGKDNATVDGRPIAHKGHMTFCPLCKGNFPIDEGLGFHTFAGVGTAVEGMKTGCGAILIATTTKGRYMIDDGGGGGEAPPAAPASAPPAKYAGSFRAVDEATGEPVAGLGYVIDLPDGTSLRGSTDADGYTERVSSHDPATVKLRWLAESGG